MEDAVAVVPRARCGHLFALVLDGHSGSAAARYLADALYPALSAALAAAGDGASDAGEGVSCPADLAPPLAKAFASVDAALLRHLAALPDPAEREAGATATVLLAGRGRLVAANVGDSRAVLCRAGAPLDLTTEHRVDGRSPASAGEVARVEAAGGWVDDGRVLGVLAVSRAFGDGGLKRGGVKATLKQGVADGAWTADFARAAAARLRGDPVVPTPDVTQVAMGAADEFVIVASDGLWDVCSSADAVRVARSAFRRGRGAAGAAAALADAASKRRTPDNVAVVVVDLGRGDRGEKGRGGVLGGLFGGR
jgi:serine/threonine protein phosphatase PrpC